MTRPSTRPGCVSPIPWTRGRPRGGKRDRRLPRPHLSGLGGSVRPSVARDASPVHPESSDATGGQGVPCARRRRGNARCALSRGRQLVGRPHRRQPPGRRVRPARLHARRRGLLRAVHARRDAAYRRASRADARADDLRACRSLRPAGGLPVFIEAPPIPDYDDTSYRKNMVRLKDLIERFADIRWVLVMGPPVRYFARDGRWDFPDDVMATYQHDNLWLEVMFPITWGGVWEYPYIEAQALIRDARDTFGASKLIWGSDMPNVERFCTYTHCVDYVRRHCNFLTAHEKDQVLGGNLDRILGLSERSRAGVAG